MGRFLSPVDIANRACQRLGVRRIGTFQDDSKQAQELGFCYDKLRRAELRRNTWRFATKHCPMRPLDFNSMWVQPSLWVSGSSYYVGAIVQTADGQFWISQINSNLNRAPGSDVAWKPYYGPLVADPYDPTKAYWPGDLAYQYVGDGTYQVYVSLQDQNAEDPSVPELWLPNETYANGDIVQFALAWSSLTAYTPGVMASLSNVTYIAVANNTNVNPSTDNGTHWVLYPSQQSATINSPGSNPVPGSQGLQSAISEWSGSASYSLGNIVTFNAQQYMALTTSANLQPNQNSSAWVLVSNAAIYQSQFDLNEGNTPSSTPPLWNSLIQYTANQQVVSPDDKYVYTALLMSTGLNPTSSPGAWQNTNVIGAWNNSFLEGNVSPTGSPLWRRLDAALSKIDLVYPIGSGPAYTQPNRFVFALPNNFLREAPQDPKQGSVSFLGAPSNRLYDDWELEGDYLVTTIPRSFQIRFVADVSDVRQMDDMFCEGLAMRMADATCETLTQSAEKKTTIRQDYTDYMTQARVVNGIETGATEEPLDNWLACRI